VIADPIFLSFDEIVEMHDAQLAEHGGMAGIRDEGQLRGACAMPEASFGGEYLTQGSLRDGGCVCLSHRRGPVLR
jgi:hypothetical protein